MELQAQKRALDERSGRISALRGVTFLLAGGLALSRVVWAFPSAIWIAAALAAAVFLGLVVFHVVLVTRIATLDAHLRLVERGLARIAGDLAKIPENGERFSIPGHAYTGDLDVFGPASLFPLVSTAETGAGERLLASWLSAPAPADEITARQDAVRELSALHRYREDLAADAVAARARGQESEPLIDWAEGHVLIAGKARLKAPGDAPAVPPAPPPPLPMGRVRAAQALSILTVILMSAGETIAALLPNAPRHLWLFPLVLQVGLLLALRPAIEPILSLVSSQDEPFGRYLALVRRVEGQPFTSPRLVAIRAALVGSSGADASKAVGALQRIVGFAELRHSGLVHFIANLLLVWDVWIAVALDAFRRKEGPKVRGWLAAIAEMEALTSLGSFAAEHPDFTFPEVTVDPLCFEAEALGHPLLPEKRRVVNDVIIAGAGRALMVTGSNMSGKSTLLRSIGLAAVLALAGAPVCAKRLRLGVCSVRTSMRIKDSLEEGVSHFYAELGRLKSVVSAVNDGERVLFLLDEVLHGTNSRERVIGAKAVVKHLLEKGAFGAVSSHDLGLVDLEAESEGRVTNVHLEESVEGEKMTFDYKVKPGPVATQNALRLMKLIGIDVEIPELG
ncbi:MAG: DNA mismatch repair protein MutS [Minicystis sp.]